MPTARFEILKGDQDETFLMTRARALHVFDARYTRQRRVAPPAPAAVVSRSFFDGLRRALNSIHRFPYFTLLLALGRRRLSPFAGGLSSRRVLRRISNGVSSRSAEIPLHLAAEDPGEGLLHGGVFSFFLLPKAASLRMRAGCFMRNSCASAASPDSQLTSAMFQRLMRCSMMDA